MVMRRIIGVCMLAGIIGTAGVPALGDTPGQGQEQLVDEMVVVKTVVKRPPGVVHRKMRFRPPAHPSAHYVFSVIVPYEAARARISPAALARRIACESGGHWYANNGQYNGIGQFAASTFYRGLSTIRSRSVTLVSTRVRRIHSRIYRTWTDGHLDRVRGKVTRQRVIIRRHGRMSTGYTDAWTQARIMSQAIAGRSAVHDSEWECR